MYYIICVYTSVFSYILYYNTKGSSIGQLSFVFYKTFFVLFFFLHLYYYMYIIIYSSSKDPKPKTQAVRQMPNICTLSTHSQTTLNSILLHIITELLVFYFYFLPVSFSFSSCVDLNIFKIIWPLYDDGRPYKSRAFTENTS